MSQPKRLEVAFVLGRLKTGGNETAALQLLQRLDRARFNPHLVVLSSETDAIAQEFEALQIPVSFIPFNPRSPLSLAWRLRRQWRAPPPDVVPCHSSSAIRLWVHLGARLAGVPRRITRVASWFDWIEPTLKRLQRYSRFVCTQNIAVSEFVGQRLLSIGSRPRDGITVIPNGCDVAKIHSRAAAARQSRPPSPPIITTVARLEEAKDHATLLQAFAIVRAAVPTARLRIVGDGPMRRSLEDLAATLQLQPAVEFLGTRRDVPELLGQSDVFAFSSHTEGFPNVLIEAMAAGVPVVSTDLPSCHEILDAGRVGILTPPHSSQDMARALLDLLEHADRREQLATLAFERVSSTYAMDRMVAAYEALLAG